MNALPPQEPLQNPLDNPLPNPMDHPDELPTGTDGTPQFGRLLIVLAIAVALIVAITFGSQSYFS